MNSTVLYSLVLAPLSLSRGQLFAHISMRRSFSYFSSLLSLRMSVSGKPQCFNMVDSNSLVNEKYKEIFPNLWMH